MVAYYETEIDTDCKARPYSTIGTSTRKPRTYSTIGTSTRAGVLYDICNVFRLIVDSGGGAVIVYAAVIGSNQTQFRRVSVFNTVLIAKLLPPPCTDQR